MIKGIDECKIKNAESKHCKKVLSEVSDSTDVSVHSMAVKEGEYEIDDTSESNAFAFGEIKKRATELFQE